MLQAVQIRLGQEPDARPDTPFADALDSMGMAEFLAGLADELGLSVAALEQLAGRRFTTVADLARTLQQAGRTALPSRPDGSGDPSHGRDPSHGGSKSGNPRSLPSAWLCATVPSLPTRRQPAHERDTLIGRPAGWLERHAGIRSFSCWGEEDPLVAAEQCGRRCLEKSGLAAHDVGALLVTSTAPPLLAGLGAILHHRLGLPEHAIPLEVGGGCCGFLAALWTAARVLSGTDNILLFCIEAPGRWLNLVPGSAGETASLFGEAAAACLVSKRPRGVGARPLLEVTLQAEGGRGGLLQAVGVPGAGVEIRMDGVELAAWAVEAMAEQVKALTEGQRLTPRDLAGVVLHAGNGRMPGLLAHRLGLSVERMLSTTAETGNLGSASLPVSALELPSEWTGPVVQVAVGVGLLSGAALLGASQPQNCS
jgi:3-oxoacyl-[acyl-carrier-protein] synthase-3